MSVANIDLYTGGWLCLGVCVGSALWFMEDLARIAAGKRQNAYASRIIFACTLAAVLVMTTGVE